MSRWGRKVFSLRLTVYGKMNIDQSPYGLAGCYQSNFIRATLAKNIKTSIKKCVLFLYFLNPFFQSLYFFADELLK